VTVRSTWSMVEVDHKNSIVYIEDICDKTGEMSITNDAENVWYHFQREGPGGVMFWRVVYKDTDGEWWEIVKIYGSTANWFGQTVSFKRWHGLVWDILQR
jgi:hypothetical protein